MIELREFVDSDVNSIKIHFVVMQDNTSVRIHEVKSGHWGDAESAWTTEKVRELKSESG